MNFIETLNNFDLKYTEYYFKILNTINNNQSNILTKLQNRILYFKDNDGKLFYSDLDYIEIEAVGRDDEEKENCKNILRNNYNENYKSILLLDLKKSNNNVICLCKYDFNMIFKREKFCIYCKYAKIPNNLSFKIENNDFITFIYTQDKSKIDKFSIYSTEDKNEIYLCGYEDGTYSIKGVNTSVEHPNCLIISKNFEVLNSKEITEQINREKIIINGREYCINNSVKIREQDISFDKYVGSWQDYNNIIYNAYENFLSELNQSMPIRNVTHQQTNKIKYKLNFDDTKLRDVIKKYSYIKSIPDEINRIKIKGYKQSFIYDYENKEITLHNSNTCLRQNIEIEKFDIDTTEYRFLKSTKNITLGNKVSEPLKSVFELKASPQNNTVHYKKYKDFNENQNKAINIALNTNDIAIIQGPPGTGKTQVISKIIKELDKKEQRTFICCYQHVAVENVIKKFNDYGEGNFIFKCGTKYGADDNELDISNSFFQKIKKKTQDTINEIKGQLNNEEYINLKNNFGNDWFDILGKGLQDIDNFKDSMKNFIEDFLHLSYTEKEELKKSINNSNLTEINKYINAIYKQCLERYPLFKKYIAYKYLMSFIEHKIPDLKKSFAVYQSYMRAETCGQSNSNKTAMKMEQDKGFDYIIMDEAARTPTIAFLLAIKNTKKLILVGDQAQLPPYFDNEIDYSNDNNTDEYKKYTNDKLLQISLFEILYEMYKEDSTRCCQLTEQYRMHKTINNLVSNIFYDNNLQASGTNLEHNLQNYKDIQIKLVNVGGDNENLENNSYYRQNEIKALIQELRNICENIKKKNDGEKVSIGIITFYSAQKNRIERDTKRLIDEYKEIISITIGTVDSFQGTEFDIVLLSMVRANRDRKIGFLAQDYGKNRFCVSLSRAKKLLIIFYHKETFVNNNENNIFNKVYEYCKNNEGILVTDY